MDVTSSIPKKTVSNRRPVWLMRLLYWYIDKLDRHGHVIFMNYGYSDPRKIVALDTEDERNRYPVQLYHHLCEMINLNGKDIVEVGCGRGGGIAYVARKYSPSSMVGIDLGRDTIAFANKHHKHRNLSFMVGDAMNLPLENNCCDIVLNVESSHRYRSMECFITEVKRMLRPGGHLLLTDFRYDHEWPALIDLFKNSGLKILLEKDITENILHSLDLDTERRISLVNKYSPGITKKTVLNFSGTAGTETYSYFQTRIFTYKSFLLQKPLD
jgi:ubiquinone/menaquinone biosynthesis C-methylase UbiE